VASADPSGLLYGAIVSAAVLVTVSAHATGKEQVVATTTVFLVVYWMAHVYIQTLSTQFRGDRHGFLSRLGTSARHETGVLKGGIPAIVVYTVVALATHDKSTGALVAAYFSVVLMMAIGYLGAHQAGVRGWPLVGEVAAGASFGIIIVIGKSFLH
jgi:hypothetical protein